MTAVIWIFVGIVFVIIALPLLQGISDVITCYFELWKSKIGIAITKNNSIALDIKASSENIQTNAIGFQVLNDNEEYDDEEEDEKKMNVTSAKMNKIGFSGGKN